MGAAWDGPRKAPWLGAVGRVPSLYKTGVNCPGDLPRAGSDGFDMRILPLDVHPSVHDSSLLPPKSLSDGLLPPKPSPIPWEE